MAVDGLGFDGLDFDGAKIVLLIGGRLLTLLRDDIATISYPGWWDMPGGGREGAESPEACVLRETREEFGLVLDPGRLAWGAVYDSPPAAASRSGSPPVSAPGRNATSFSATRGRGGC